MVTEERKIYLKFQNKKTKMNVMSCFIALKIKEAYNNLLNQMITNDTDEETKNRMMLTVAKIIYKYEFTENELMQSKDMKQVKMAITMYWNNIGIDLTHMDDPIDEINNETRVNILNVYKK